MRYIIKKWYLIILLAFVTEIVMDSCSRVYRYKKMIKRRKSAISKRYTSPYQKKLKRNIIPINQNYIIKNKRNTRGVPMSGRRR
jgi:hypothetical protein